MTPLGLKRILLPLQTLYQRLRSSSVFPRNLQFQNHLSRRFFELGNKTHLIPDDSCHFFFEGDCCCWADFLFNIDNTFYGLYPCVTKERLTSGTYAIIEDSVFLEFSGIWVSKNHAIADLLAQTSDSSTAPSWSAFQITSCGNKIELRGARSIMLEIPNSYEQKIKHLTSELLIGRLEDATEGQKYYWLKRDYSRSWKKTRE